MIINPPSDAGPNPAGRPSASRDIEGESMTALASLSGPWVPPRRGSVRSAPDRHPPGGGPPLFPATWKWPFLGPPGTPPESPFWTPQDPPKNPLFGSFEAPPQKPAKPPKSAKITKNDEKHQKTPFLGPGPFLIKG